MVGEAFAGLSAVKTAFDLAKGLQNIHDTAARDRAVIELQKEILAAQQTQATLIQSVSDLEKEVARLKAWDADKQRYKLTDIRPGVMAYSLKEGMEAGEPAHQLCASCYNAGHKSFLAEELWQPGRCTVLVCHDCGSYYYKAGASDAAHKAMKPKPYRGE